MDAALISILNTSGVTAHGRDYLEARGLVNVQMFVRCCPNEEQFLALVVQPFIDGWDQNVGDKVIHHKSPDDLLFTRGAFCWARSDAVASLAPPPAPASDQQQQLALPGAATP